MPFRNHPFVWKRKTRLSERGLSSEESGRNRLFRICRPYVHEKGRFREGGNSRELSASRHFRNRGTPHRSHAPARPGSRESDSGESGTVALTEHSLSAGDSKGTRLFRPDAAQPRNRSGVSGNPHGGVSSQRRDPRTVCGGHFDGEQGKRHQRLLPSEGIPVVHAQRTAG